jgi:hypothetical protein
MHLSPLVPLFLYQLVGPPLPEGPLLLEDSEPASGSLVAFFPLEVTLALENTAGEELRRSLGSSSAGVGGSASDFLRNMLNEDFREG